MPPGGFEPAKPASKQAAADLRHRSRGLCNIRLLKVQIPSQNYLTLKSTNNLSIFFRPWLVHWEINDRVHRFLQFSPRPRNYVTLA
jgi:hypothetical protein